MGTLNVPGCSDLIRLYGDIRSKVGENECYVGMIVAGAQADSKGARALSFSPLTQSL
jgi:hypothetical protein